MARVLHTNYCTVVATLMLMPPPGQGSSPYLACSFRFVSYGISVRFHDENASECLTSITNTVLLLSCLQSDNVQHELHRWSLINIPRKNQKTPNLCIVMYCELTAQCYVHTLHTLSLRADASSECHRARHPRLCTAPEASGISLEHRRYRRRLGQLPGRCPRRLAGAPRSAFIALCI